jgi:hypothetical protein
MESKCPKCGAVVAVGERFCAACGSGVAVGDDGVVVAQQPAALPLAVAAPSQAQRDAIVGRARKWLFAISIITLLSGGVFYALNKSDVEKQIHDAEVATQAMDPGVRDEAMKQQTGMTFAEACAHDRGQVNLLLVVNIALALFYLGMWFWAKRNVRAATLVALLTFITVIVVNAAIDPKTLAQGVIVKILFIAALGKAVQVARENPLGTPAPAP